MSEQVGSIPTVVPEWVSVEADKVCKAGGLDRNIFAGAATVPHLLIECALFAGLIVCIQIRRLHRDINAK